MVHREEAIRAAAESLLGSSSSYQLPSVSYSINAPLDSVARGDVISGSRIGGRMSVVRRFFCLFVTFDFLFTSLMWLICIMLFGDDVFSALDKQVVHYSIHRSLFDVVMGAACRFVILLLFYALLHINHWFIVALTTTATSAFLIVKVFNYNWTSVPSPVFQVLLILTSFVLAWGEVWFLDFRVIPQEVSAELFMRGSLISDSERAPLLRSSIRGSHAERHDSTAVNFYSPFESFRGSEEDLRAIKPLVDDLQPHPEDSELLQLGRQILEDAWNSLNSPDWRLQNTTLQGDSIYSRKADDGTKIYRLTGEVEIPPQELLDLLHYKVESMPSWNPTVEVCERIRIINETTDLVYQISAGGGVRIVSSRDFMNLRHWGQKNGCYVTAVASISLPSHPPQSKYIRGENGPSCWAMEPSIENPSHSSVQWLLHTKLKGWLPQAIVEAAFSTVMSDFMTYLRTHIQRLHSSE